MAQGDTVAARPKLAIWKFASCDGCQLMVFALERELLTLAEVADVVHFPEASSHSGSGPYDISLVEGSISTRADHDKIREVREQSRILVTIGACATAGGVQALVNFTAAQDGKTNPYTHLIYPQPEYVDSLATSTAIAEHVHVDFELRGCPISKSQLASTLSDLLDQCRPQLPTYSVCVECKRRGLPCILVSAGSTCMGPVTQAGCGALCPAYGRACYGCFGPAEETNTPALLDKWQALGINESHARQKFETFNAASEPFRRVHQDHDKD